MKPIGTFTPENPFFLAPMEAVNCASFRVLCKRRGAGLVYTDMIDADVFYEYAQEHSVQDAITKFINAQNEEYPLVIQLGGGKIETLIFTAKAIHDVATIIDFNVGCPLGYMLGKKGGVYLQKHPDQLYKIIQELREVIKKPFTVKIRAGWDEHSINAVEVAKELERLGVDAVTLHPRTRTQRAKGNADWKLAQRVAKELTIPFILSGDVTNVFLAKKAFEQTGCDYIMLARGAQKNPSVFLALNNWWKTKQVPKTNNTRYEKETTQVQTDLREFLLLYKQKEHQEKLGQLQDHFLWFAAESKNNKELTQNILATKTREELEQLISQFKFS